MLSACHRSVHQTSNFYFATLRTIAKGLSVFRFFASNERDFKLQFLMITDAKTCSRWSEYRGPSDSTEFYPENLCINQKIVHWRGDMTRLRIDSIVNAANNSLLGGGGIDGAIHRAAGRQLYNYCDRLNGCNTGEAKISPGFLLPAKFIIHTVGPVGENQTKLASCYTESLELVKDTKDDSGNQLIREICFCCISTGVYGYPNKKAAKVALKTIRNWLESSEENMSSVDLIVFCTFTETDFDIYNNLMPLVFPRSVHNVPAEVQDARGDDGADEKAEIGRPEAVAEKVTANDLFVEQDVDFVNDSDAARNFK